MRVILTTVDIWNGCTVREVYEMKKYETPEIQFVSYEDILSGSETLGNDTFVDGGDYFDVV